MRCLIFSSFLVVLLAFQTAFGGWCGYELNGQKPLFEYIDHRLNMEHWDRKHLGHGSTADVYIQFDKNRNNWIAKKIYKMGSPKLSQEAKVQDVQAMEFLLETRYVHGLKVVKYENHSSELHVVEMAYVPGKTLEQVLNDKSVSEEIKNNLYQKYRTAISMIYQEMQNRKFSQIEFVRVSRQQSRSTSHEALKADHLSSAGMISWFLKPDNIMVDPFTLELIVVDPR